jgi:hypothetical protein
MGAYLGPKGLDPRFNVRNFKNFKASHSIFRGPAKVYASFLCLGQVSCRRFLRSFSLSLLLQVASIFATTAATRECVEIDKMHTF